MHIGFWLGKPGGKRTFRGPRGRWDDNIKMVKGMEWMYLVEDRDRWRDLVNAVMDFRVP